jgi:phage protein D/phage baseplate assembly protein gpV
MNSVVMIPEVVVEVNGTRLSADVIQSLGEVRVQQRLSLPTQCELNFYEAGESSLGASALSPGSALRLTLTGHPEVLFAGEVVAVEYVYGPSRERVVRIRAYDVLHRLRKRQEVRAHVQVSFLELVRELVRDLEITVRAGDSGLVWQRIIQHGQSDFDLLLEYAERCGVYFWLHDRVLSVLTLNGAGDVVPLSLGDTLLEARVELNGESACRSVTTFGWDPARARSYQGGTRRARVGRHIETDMSPSRVHGTGERTQVNASVENEPQATAMAQAELDVRVAREVTVWGVAEGDPRLRPGTRIDVQGVDRGIAGRYVLTMATHTVDSDKGYITELSTVPPMPQTRVRSTSVAPGVVTNIDDPDELGRVKVSLPSYRDVETDWMGILVPGAGIDKGLVALPDVGDVVLVLFAQSNPAHGIVLGGLYGEQLPPDSGIGSGAIQRYTFVTPGGQRVQLDDGRATIRLENSDGSAFELSPDRVRLYSQRDLDIDAPNQRIRIRGRAIDFEQL